MIYPKVLPLIQANTGPGRTVVPRNRLGARNSDLLAGLAWVCRPDPLAAVRDVLRNLTGRQHIFFTPSGRCAIAQVLSFLPHREVVMPACTCPLVKTAAEVAGKRIIYADLARNSVNATSAEYADAAKPGRILLATHLFGIPTDIEAICELAKDRDCVVIEDVAAAFGSRRNGRLMGTFADFGIFSFQRSKRLPAFGGAIIVNNEQAVDPIKLGASRVAKTQRAMPFRELVQALVHNVATAPWIYGRFTAPLLSRRYRRAPATENANQRTAITHTPAYTREFHPYQAELLLRMLRRMDEICEQIARLAATYLEAFRNTPVATFLPPECDNAGLLRFPIAFPRKERAEILRLALERGLDLAANYPVLPEISEHARFPNAVWAARNLVLLPLYPTLSPQSARLLAQQLIEVENTA
jgi:dTDP-4-amino-4,6-dideoxygalactose transaminase